MSLAKALCNIKLFFLKLRFGKRLEIKSNKQSLRMDTEIFVGKNAFLSLGSVSAKTNVHFLCSHGEIHIGSLVAFNRNCIIACRHRIEIGDKCLFGPNVCVYDHDHAYNVDEIMRSEYKCSEVIIEDNCWIGAGAIILRGTHIGKNSIIEAGAVVKGNIPPNSLVTTNREIRIIPTTLFSSKRKNL